MEQVLAVIDYWRDRIEDHPLHNWLVTPGEDVRPEQKLWFALYFTNFIMYFRELNLYHISYGEDRKLDPQREAISAHADEDMTHSRLFIRDLHTLGWDDLLSGTALILVEWPERARTAMPSERVAMGLEHLPGDPDRRLLLTG